MLNPARHAGPQLVSSINIVDLCKLKYVNATSPPSSVSSGFQLSNFPKEDPHQQSHVIAKDRGRSGTVFSLPLFFTIER